jgi:DNA-binding NarL/FixJ family response regulator
MLESTGARVIPVSSAEEALEVLTAIPEIQAAVIDVQLSPHGMNGLDLARKVHEAYSIGLVVMSGRAAPDEGQLPPGTHFLAKPVYRHTLVHLTRELISRRLVTASQAQASAEREKMLEAKTGAELSLTRRQHEVLSLIVQGRSNEEIADELGMALNTMKAHLAGIYRALGVTSRAEALLVGARNLQSRP